MDVPTISARGLTKRYDTTVAVDDLSLDLYPGEVFGLLGPNGAGKTTTILMLLGLTEPTSGSVEVLGLDPTRHPLEVKRRVGYMPDAVGFYETLTGIENLRYTARLNRMTVDEARLRDLLAMVGLAATVDQTVGTYSRGMRQRLGIADALVKDPRILILDEPTTAIDPEGVVEMLDLIRGLADDGLTVLLSSHLLHQVETVCDRVAIFVNGQIVAQGSPHQLAVDHPGPELVEITVRNADRLDPSALAGNHVKDLSPTRRPDTWRVEVDPGTTPALIASLVGAGAEITSVHRLSDDLDSVYRRYFHRENSHV